MNPQWGTPPNGDFAHYVEQLTARGAHTLKSAPAQASDDFPEASRDGQTAPARMAPSGATFASPGAVTAETSLHRPALGTATARAWFGLLIALLVGLNLLFQIPGLVLSILIAALGWIVLQAYSFLNGEQGKVLRERLEQLQSSKKSS